MIETVPRHKEPDTRRLGELYQEIKGLSKSGSLTKGEYRRIATEAAKAAAGASDLTAFVMLFAEDSWIEEANP